MIRSVLIAGAGGMAREALAWVHDSRPELAVKGFVAGPSTQPGTRLEGLPVWPALPPLSATDVTLGMILGIGEPALRRRVAAEALSAGYELVTLVHPTSYIGPGVDIDSGAILAANVIATRDITIGRGAIVNYGASIGHDGIVQAFAFVGPGCVLGGNVTVQEGAYVGLGASVLPGRTIERGAIVGAGAVVTRDVAPEQTVLGVPARPVEPGNDGRA